MKINGSIVTGLYLFVRGIIYTKGDLIWYTDNETLYVVIEDYNGASFPDASNACVDYFEYHEWSETNNNDEALVTAKALKSILNYYIKGLKGDRKVETIIINSISELDALLETSVYQCIIPSACVIDIPSGTYLLNIYKTGDTVIQEFVDYVAGIVIYRYYKNSQFSGVSILPSTEGWVDRSKWEYFIGKLSSMSVRFRNFYNKAKTALESQTFRFVNIPEKYPDDTEVIGYYRIEGTNEYIVDGVSSDNIMNIIINYASHDTTQQFNINAYLTNCLNVTHKLVDLDNTELTVHLNYDNINHQIKITVSDENLSIIKMYIDNGN